MDDPGSSDQFSLRWNNFHTNLTTEFHALLQGEDLVDVTIAADGKFIRAHKIVLSVCSPYFKELFKINPCKHPIVILQDVGYGALCGLLQFMYCGEVSVNQEELGDFLKTAELLQVKGLTGNDSQEQTKTATKRPPTPETKRKSKMPRRIIVGEHIEQDNKEKVNLISDKMSISPTRSIVSGNSDVSSLTVTPQKESIDYSEIADIEPSSAECSVVSSGESSTFNSYIQKDVGQESMKQRQDGGSETNTAKPIELEKLPDKKEKTCWVCSIKGGHLENKRIRKRARTVCSRCQEGCHYQCFFKHKCKRKL